MAVIIEVSIQLNVDRSRPAQEARFWIDTQTERGLNTEIEVPLNRTQNQAWIGTLALDHKTPQFLYRIGLLAHAGAMWSLTIRNRTHGHSLLSDSDELGSGKAWLTGVCALARVCEHFEARTAGAGPSVTSSKAPRPPATRIHGPRLLLLDR